MSKKHYIMIANAIYQATQGNLDIKEYALIRALSIAFQDDNPDFDTERFLSACMGSNMKRCCINCFNVIYTNIKKPYTCKNCNTLNK